MVPWGKGTRSVNSVVLIANGLSFAIMTLIFVWLGSAADYGSFGSRLLIVLSVICWIAEYGFMGITKPDQWPTAMALFIISYIAYGATLVFYAAIFPRLARYMPEVRKAREEDLKQGRISQEEYDKIESLEKNHLSNISTAHSNIGYVLTLVINLSVLLPLQGNNYANNWALFLTNTCKLLSTLKHLFLTHKLYRLGFIGSLVVHLPAEASRPKAASGVSIYSMVDLDEVPLTGSGLLTLLLAGSRCSSPSKRSVISHRRSFI